MISGVIALRTFPLFLGFVILTWGFLFKRAWNQCLVGCELFPFALALLAAISRIWHLAYPYPRSVIYTVLCKLCLLIRCKKVRPPILKSFPLDLLTLSRIVHSGMLWSFPEVLIDIFVNIMSSIASLYNFVSFSLEPWSVKLFDFF